MRRRWRFEMMRLWRRSDVGPTLVGSLRTTTEEPGWREKMEILSVLNDTEILPSAQNRTTNSLWLFFNRIPRTAGQTIVTLMKELGNDLDYSHQEHSYRTPWQRLLTSEEQKNLATWFEYNFWPKSYDRFSLYVNFTQHRSPYVNMKPIYISMVRDPVDKFISNYRYARVDLEKAKMEMNARDRVSPGTGRQWYWKKLEDCVTKNDLECDTESEDIPDFLSIIPFFCGQNPKCTRHGDKWALQMAKFNAEYEYSVIGLTEELNKTLVVMEHYIPMFFLGAPQKYWHKNFPSPQANKNPKKYKPASEEVRKILKSKMSLEYEMYEFLRQRLEKQYLNVVSLAETTTKLVTKPTEKSGLSAWDIFEIEIKPRLSN